MKRLLCWLLGGHAWDEWRPTVWINNDSTVHRPEPSGALVWTSNVRQEGRLCLRCWRFERRGFPS